MMLNAPWSEETRLRSSGLSKQGRVATFLIVARRYTQYRISAYSLRQSPQRKAHGNEIPTSVFSSFDNKPKRRHQGRDCRATKEDR